MPPARSPAPRVVVRNTSTSTTLPPRHFGTSAKTHYSSLPLDEQQAEIEREEQEFKQYHAFPHERNPPLCNEYTERDWKIFEKASKEYYEIQGGRQCVMARMLPGSIACINWILESKYGRPFDFLKEMTEEQQLEFIYSHFRASLSFDKLSDDVTSIRMTCKEFSQVALDSFGGKFHTLMNVTYKEVWQKTKLKTQTSLFVNAISPPHLSHSIALKLEQENFTNIHEAFALIQIAAKNEVERLLGNDKAKLLVPDKASLSLPDKTSLPKPKVCDEDKTPVIDIRANFVKSGEEPCASCILFGTNKSSIRHPTKACRFACACGEEPQHFAAAKGEIICHNLKSPKKGKHVSIIHEEEEDYDNPEPRILANRTHQVNSVTMSHYNPLGIIDESEMADLDDPPLNRAYRVRLQDSLAQTNSDNARNIYSQFTDRELDDFFSEEYGYAPGERIVIADPDTILQALTARRVTMQLSNED